MNSSSDELQSALRRAEQLQKTLDRRERQIGALRRVSEGLSLLGGETLIGQAMDVALSVLGACAGAVLLYDAQDDTLVFRCVLGPCAQSLTGVRIAASQGIAGQVLRTGQPDVTHHAGEQEGSHILRSDAHRKGDEDEVILTVPLQRASGDAIGVMQLLWAGSNAHEEADFDEGDLHVVQVLCAGVVAALETARLSGQARRAEVVSIIGDISHDIKNMLTPIQSGLWTLEPLLDRLFEGLESIREQSKGRAAQGEIERTMELVRDDYGWILQGAHSACDQVTARTREIADAVKGELAAPVFESANLNDVVGEVVRPLFMLADQTNVHLHIELDHDLPRAEFDRKQIYNALYNLVNNAIPETPSGGSVTIRTKSPASGEDTLLLEVEDTGRGVPEHVRKFLFTDQAVSTKSGGTGLGTRIVGGVVRRHHGSITVKSELGQGSTFSIRLPLRQRVGGEPDIAPPSALPIRRHNLPVPATSFVGRGDERTRVREMLQYGGARLLTLTGVAGTGKTRLALQVAMDIVDSFEDGAWLVALAPIDNAERVTAVIAATLGVREGPGRGLESSLVDFLRSKHLLLLLDNFEQVLAAAPLIANLLGECAGLKVLVTSRSLLHLRGERELSVAPLGLPRMASFPTNPTAARVRELAQCEAITLFVERAAQVRPDFELSPENARDVALICTRMDGLPLAIELAAARIKIFSPRAIRTHLDNHLPLPASGPQDAPRRHQTLRAAFDWSYNLLAPAEQILLRRLMVFEGGCSPESARAIAAVDEMGLDVWRGLELLCDKSLLRHVEQSDGSTWFFALGTLREYGREKMVQNGELEAVRRRHAEYYLTIAESAEQQRTRAPEAAPPLPGVPHAQASSVEWLEWRKREYDNLQAALLWFLDDEDAVAGDAAHSPDERPAHGALRMAMVLRAVLLGGHWNERREALQRALEKNTDAPDEMRLKAMLYIGDLATLQGDHVQAAQWGEKSLELSRRCDDAWGIARALGILAGVALEQGDLDSARAMREESLAIHQETGNQGAAAWALYYLGVINTSAGDRAEARDLFVQSLAAFRAMEDSQGIAWSLYNVGVVEYSRHDPAPTERLLEEGLEIFREVEGESGIAWSLCFLGKIAGHKGDFNRAHAFLDESLELARQLGDRWSIASALWNRGDVALTEGHHDEARAALCEAGAMLGEMNNTARGCDLLRSLTRLAIAQGEMTRAAHLLGAYDALADGRNDEEEQNEAILARRTLGDEAFNTAWQEGRALNLQDALNETCGS